MNENQPGGVRRTVAATGMGAVAAVAVGILVAGAARADAVVPLPDGQKVSPSGSVTITRTAERAVVSPSMAANGAGRVVWVSGTAIAEVAETPEGEVGPYNGPSGRPGSDNSSTHGASQLNTGYIVGCQVSIADDAISAGISGGITTSGANAGGSIGLKLGPGEVKFVQLSAKDILRAGTYAIDYQDAEIEIQGRAGYAQARAYTVVEIIGDHYSKTTLYGMPFSIG